MNRQLTAKTNTKYRKTERERKKKRICQNGSDTKAIPISRIKKKILHQKNIFRKFFRRCSGFS